CADGDCGCRVAGNGLQVDGPGFDRGALNLVLDEKTVVVVAEQDRRRKSRRGSKPRQGRTEKARLGSGKETNELLRIHSSGQRPKPGSGTTGQDYWIDLAHGVSLDLATSSSDSARAASAGRIQRERWAQVHCRPPAYVKMPV